MAPKYMRQASQREQSPPVTHHAPSASPAPPVLVPTSPTATANSRDIQDSSSLDLNSNVPIVPTNTSTVPPASGEPLNSPKPRANSVIPNLDVLVIPMPLTSSDVPNIPTMSPKPQVHTDVPLDVPQLPTMPTLAVPSDSRNASVPIVSPLSPTADGSSCNHLPLNSTKPSADSGHSSSVDADIPNEPPHRSVPLIVAVPLSPTVPKTDASYSKTLEVEVPPIPPEILLLTASSTPLDSFVIQRYNDIMKSKSDKREYRALVLSNQMKVFLVSDNAAETSTAALQVNVGHCSDPDDLPGLAHFCEHMLFLGTEKYPQENEYSKFLSEHGGWSNACTGTDFTKYYFEVLPPHLGAALDIFAQFFISPLFTESATERELSAVDSEHQNNLQSDGWRLTQVDKSSAKLGHPYRKFGTGNRQTLESVPKEKGIDVRQELLKFHQMWYSSNIMALSVFGKESLDELEAMVAPLFSSVKNSAVEPPSWTEHPFPPALRRKCTYCEPVADFRSLAIEFPVSEYSREHDVGSPYGYLSHLIGHEGPGSLLSALKSQGWCNSLEAGRSMTARGFGLFGICVDLTEDGVEHVDDIVALTFQYIAMLRSRGPQREVWEEQTDLSKLAFRFEDPSNPVSLANSLVDVLQEYPRLPLKDVLSTWRTTEWRPDMIVEALAQFTPQNVRLQIVAKYFANKCTQEEPWYGTKFVEEDIEPDKLKGETYSSSMEWESLSPNPELLMPPPNEFIPSRVELEERSDPTCESIAPEIIKDTPFMRLWFKQDNEFLLPKASIEFDINSPLPAQSARNIQLTAIWVMLVEDSLQESTYAAGLASLSWGLNWCLDSISISIDGFDEKQHLLLEMIMDRIATVTPDPRRFVVMKEKRIKDLKNRDMDQPCQHADDELDSCLSERVWLTVKQRLDAIESLTVEMLIDYMPRFLRSVYVEGIAFGNLTRTRALRLAEIVENRIPKDAVPVLAQDLLLSRAIEIEEGSYYLREISTIIHTASCAMIYVECGVYDARSAIVLELLGKILQEPCFDTLRTKEHLGYIVSVVVRHSFGVHGAVVLVQGDLHPGRLEQRIEAFLQEAEEYLENMSEEEFVRHRSALAALRAERPKTIYSEKAHLWGEIVMQTYNFDRARVEVEVINAIAKEELIQFYKKHITPHSSVRRKLSVHVVSTAEGGAGYISDKSDKSDNDKHSLCSPDKEEDSAQVLLTGIEYDGDKSDINDKHGQCSTKKQEPSISSSAGHNSDKPDKSDNDKPYSCSLEQELSSIASDVRHDGDKSVKSDDNEKYSQCSTEKQDLSEPLISSDVGDGGDNCDKSDKSGDNKTHNQCSRKKQELSEPLIYSAGHDGDNSDKSDNDEHSSCSSQGQELSTIHSRVSHDGDKSVNDNDKECHCSSDKRDMSSAVSENGDKSDKLGDNNEKQPIKITDLIEFKSRRRLYPRPTASTTVPKRGS